MYDKAYQLIQQLDKKAHRRNQEQFSSHYWRHESTPLGS